MTDLSGVYMRAPETWPFKTPTITSKLVPSHKTYAPNNEGLVFVDPRDIATLLGLGFYLYGPNPNINALLAGLPGAGDPSMFLAMDGVGRTPAGSGSSGLVMIDSGGPPDAPQPYLDFSLPLTQPWFAFDVTGIVFNVVEFSGDILGVAVSIDGETFLTDTSNIDTYSIVQSGGDAVHQGIVTPGGSLTSGGHLITSIIRVPLFNPGSANELTNFELRHSWDGFGNIGYASVLAFLNPNATVPPIPARATKVRIFPNGYGDVNVLSSGNTMSWTAWHLWGPAT